MKNKVVIRDCKKADLTELQSLVEELYITDTGPKAVIPEVLLTYQALKASPQKGRLLIFEQAEAIVGYAIIIFFWSNEFGGDIVDVDEILVTKSARGTGVATKFFKWLAREYKGQASGWSLQVKPANKRAFKLYQSVGFRNSANWHMYNIFAWKNATLSGRVRITGVTTEGGKTGAIKVGKKSVKTTAKQLDRTKKVAKKRVK